MVCRPHWSACNEKSMVKGQREAAPFFPFFSQKQIPAYMLINKAIGAFTLEYKDIGWWYWLATVVFMSIGLCGYAMGFILAIGLMFIQLTHYSIREKNFTAFPVQVRYWYLLLVLISWPDFMQWLYWAPTIGTWIQIFFGYCAMARLVALLPWNRNEPLSFRLLRRTFFSPPVKGSIQQIVNE